MIETRKLTADELKAIKEFEDARDLAAFAASRIKIWVQLHSDRVEDLQDALDTLREMGLKVPV